MLLFKTATDNITGHAGDPHLDTSLSAGTYRFFGVINYMAWSLNNPLGIRLSLSAGSGHLAAVHIASAPSDRSLFDGCVNLPSTDGVAVGAPTIGDVYDVHISGYFELTGVSPSVNVAYRNISGSGSFEYDIRRGSWLQIDAV